ncbi:Preprotein translocase subunit SecB [compost metagenome]
MEQATFSFKSYKIERFLFNLENGTEDKISIKIDPQGVFISDERKFILTFHFYAFEKEKTYEKSFVECTLTAEFLFSENIKTIEDIPQYFYPNSIAIVFPYLRSFISSLTIQANIKPVILPTMNLTSLSTPLKENVVVK